MGKELCIVHANCQAEPLIQRLITCPEFSARYDYGLITNFVKEPVTDEILSRCSLFLYQYLGPKWDDLASDVLISKLPDGARSLCIPNLFFKGYWPLWNSKPGFNYRCSYLDDIIDKGLPAKETAMLFLYSDIAARFDLLEIVKETIEKEREKEKHTPVKYLDLLIDNYRDSRLFNTVNHPGSLLMNHVAKEVLIQLGYTPPPDSVLEAVGEPFPEFEQPINPKIAQFFGWDFGGPDVEFEIYGRKMNYARYVSNYIIAQQAGVTDFISFLQGANVAI